jgi:hypothetical protein
MLRRTTPLLLVFSFSPLLSLRLPLLLLVGTIGDPRAMLEQSGSTYSLASLPFESCQVSLASCRLLKLVHEVIMTCLSLAPSLLTLYQVMKQACSTQSSSYSTMLYQVRFPPYRASLSLAITPALPCSPE